MVKPTDEQPIMLKSLDIGHRATGAVTALFLLVALVTELQGHLGAQTTTPSLNRSCCPCCAPAAPECPTPNCCAAPASGPSPISQSSLPARGGNELRSLPCAGIVIAVVAGLEKEANHSRPVSLLASRAVPLFQRDCSYLI